MTGISAIPANPYPVAEPKAAVGESDETVAAELEPMGETAGQDRQELRVNSSSANIDAAMGGGSTVEQLQKQIEQTQKMLDGQQAQMASVARGQATDEQKAQQAMEIQTQIAVTNSTLMGLQAALLQALFSVDVHA